MALSAHIGVFCVFGGVRRLCWVAVLVRAPDHQGMCLPAHGCTSCWVGLPVQSNGQPSLPVDSQCVGACFAADRQSWWQGADVEQKGILLVHHFGGRRFPLAVCTSGTKHGRLFFLSAEHLTTATNCCQCTSIATMNPNCVQKDNKLLHWHLHKTKNKAKLVEVEFCADATPQFLSDVCFTEESHPLLHVEQHKRGVRKAPLKVTLLEVFCDVRQCGKQKISAGIDIHSVVVSDHTFGMFQGGVEFRSLPRFPRR